MYKVEITGVDTSKLKALSSSEQKILLEKIKAGDMEAREKMINGNLKLVLAVLKKFNNKNWNVKLSNLLRKISVFSS